MPSRSTTLAESERASLLWLGKPSGGSLIGRAWRAENKRKDNKAQLLCARGHSHARAAKRSDDRSSALCFRFRPAGGGLAERATACCGALVLSLVRSLAHNGVRIGTRKRDDILIGLMSLEIGQLQLGCRERGEGGTERGRKGSSSVSYSIAHAADLRPRSQSAYFLPRRSLARAPRVAAAERAVEGKEAEERERESSKGGGGGGSCTKRPVYEDTRGLR